jgi:hypothetical protein
VFDLIDNAPADSTEPDAKLVSFWNTIVDTGLFGSPKPKHKFLGFRLFELLLVRLTGHVVPPPSCSHAVRVFFCI